MRPVSATISIDVPRERVFDLICDLSRRPAFTDHFQHDFRLGRLDPLGVGASGRLKLADSPWSSMDTAIEEVERPHLVREHGCGGRANRIDVFTVWELAEGPSPDGCEVTVVFWTEPKTLFDRVREPFPSPRRLRRDWAKALRRLRDLAESEASAEPVKVAGTEPLPTLTG
jgi:uncharacterized protein YndB with AHSA1/START domain